MRLKTKTRKPMPKKMEKVIEEKFKAILEKDPSSDVTQSNLIEELNQVIVLAKLYRQPSAMVAAIKAKAQLHGLLVDTVKHEGDLNMTHRVSKFDIDMRVNSLIEESLTSALS